jgi:predicted dehydrogenase
MNKRVRVAVIGAGAIGVAHVRGFQTHPQVEVVAVAETHPERRAEACVTFGIAEGVEDYRTLLDRKDIDVVSVALPNHLHVPVGLEALEAGKHVLMEKPIATNANDAARLVEEAERRGLLFMVGQNQRFAKAAQSAKQYVASGAAGEIYHLEAFWLRRSGIPRMGSWFTKREFAGGGCCYDIGVHMLDLALHLVGDFDAESVSGQTFAKFGPRGLGEGGWGKSEADAARSFDVEDFATALIRMKSGRTVILQTAWACYMPEGSLNNVRLYGTEGGVSVFPFEVYRRGAEHEFVTEKPEPAACLVNEVREAHFVDCVLGNAEPFVPARQSLAVQRILDAIYESGRLNKEVRI